MRCAIFKADCLGQKIIWIWLAVLVLFFAGLGAFSIMTVYRYKMDTLARHNARVDPRAVEPGRTEVDDTLPPDAKPARVKLGIYLDRISAISILDARWSLDFYIWFKWTGNNIAPGDDFRIVDGEILARTKVQEYVDGDEHYALFQVKAEITKFFDASLFPLDEHLLTIGVEDSKLTRDKLEFVADTLSSNISSRVKMPGYKLYKFGMVIKPHTYKSNFSDPRLLSRTDHATYSQLIFGIWNKRPGLGVYVKVFLGLFAAVAIGLLAFFISPTHGDYRYGLGVGAFFGAVANTLLSVSMAPASGVMTLLDMVNLIGILTIFIILIETTIAQNLIKGSDGEDLARRFDRLSLLLIAPAYLAINWLIPMAALID